MTTANNVLRTPDSRFTALPDYPFEPHYVEVDGLRMHYVDEGPRTEEVVLMLHGEPSWSFLYRKMIPVVAAAGYRVVAPDLIGFGRSDKPADPQAYSYQQHVDWMTAFVRELDLRDITLVGQDWGGLIGLRLAAEDEERFSRICIANTALPTGQGALPEAFQQWREFSRTSPVFPIGRIVSMGCAQTLSDEVVAAYDAPFPDDSYKAGARIFPSLVPADESDPAVPANRRAWEVLRRWEKPFLTCFSDGDPITRGGEAAFQKLVPGAQGRSHPTIQGGGHFLQEDKGEEWAEVIVAFLQET